MAIGSLPLTALLSASTMNFAALNPLRPSAAVSKLFPNANAAAASAGGGYGATNPDPPLNMKDPGRYPPPAPAGLSTTAKIAIAGGVVAALVVVAAIAKKRKKRR